MADLNVRLLRWQQEVWKDPTRFKIVAAGRRTGKSRLAAWELIVKALEAPSGCVVYVAPTQGQARDIMWNLLLDLAGPVISKTKKPNVNNLEIQLVNGIIIKLKGADRPETMRGLSIYYLVLDEYADIRPDVWELILRPALTDLKGEALFIGTPMGRNHFFDLYKIGELGTNPDIKSWHFTSYDNETLDPKEIDAAKNSMSSFAFRQEYMASFEASGSEVFKEDWIKFSDPPERGDYYIAIDLAGFQEMGKIKTRNKRLDDSAICVTKVTENGDWYVENIIHGRWELGETAEKIFTAVRDYQPVRVGIEKGIAKQAVMSPLQDLMRQRSRFFSVDELTHGNQKKKDRVIWALQGRFEHGRVHVCPGEWNEKFLDQLFQFPNELVHDDLVDALAYIDQLATIPYGIGEFQQTDYIPLDDITGY